ncbi:MAG: hypothetical protein HGA96_13995 [Desulfobulbaceae bacterium]|nr:hypothetical protein [Desulfobulbaceae bacterium]
MDNNRCLVRIYWGFLLLLAIIFLSPKLVMSADSGGAAENCIACHEDVWRDVQSKMYVHQPVREKDCKYCHIAVRADADSKRGAYLNKVTWVARSMNQSTEHWLEIDGPKRGATLLVEARSRSGLLAKVFPLPALDDLEELPVSDLKPLEITNIKVLEVMKGVFVSVTIGWDTDRQADSQVYYGLDKLDQKTILDTQYTRNHAVTLTGVKLGKSYKYKVVSVDVAGNRSESNVQSMVAEISPGKTDVIIGSRDRSQPEMTVKYYRKGGKCIVVVGSEQTVSVSLGLLPKKYEDGEYESDLKVVRHLQLNLPETTNTGICYDCHGEYKKILSHPINVYPKRGMSIPPEYPTLSDGRITCMSCHDTHASNVEFRLIKSDRRDLCRGCHKDIA